MNRRRLTADRWRDLIREQRHSGLSIAAFCAAHDVAASTFFVWRRKVEVGDGPTFVELTPAIDRSTVDAATAAAREGESAHAPIELLLPGGLTLRVRAGAAAQAVVAVGADDPARVGAADEVARRVVAVGGQAGQGIELRRLAARLVVAELGGLAARVEEGADPAGFVVDGGGGAAAGVGDGRDQTSSDYMYSSPCLFPPRQTL